MLRENTGPSWFKTVAAALAMCALGAIGTRAPAQQNQRIEPVTIKRRGTGFRGRRAIGELLVPSRKIDRLVFDGADEAAIERAAIDDGMRPIFDSGLLAVLEGDTTIEEVVRCIRSDA